MKDTLLRLRKKIPDNLREILQTIFSRAGELDIPVFVVGATARDLIFEYIYKVRIQRATEDVDFGIAVKTWAEYENLKRTLLETGKFEDDAKEDQRIWWKKGSEETRIDLVPYGGLESPAGEIAFPPDGNFKMTTHGFTEAFENALFLEVTKDLTVKIASLPGLALLKFIAYNDRPHERSKDLQDIWFIAENYMKIEESDERLFGENAKDNDLLNDENFNYETCGARLLGRDIAGLLNSETKDIVINTLSEEKDAGRIQTFTDIIYGRGLRDENLRENILKSLREIKRGIEERL